MEMLENAMGLTCAKCFSGGPTASGIGRTMKSTGATIATG